VTIAPPIKREMHVVHSRGDKVFRRLVTAGALTSLVVLGLIGAFLFGRGAQVFSQYGLKFITGTNWATSLDESIASEFGIGPMLVGTVIVSAIAMLFAVPMSIAGALYIEFYATGRVRRILSALLDLAAAIPSLIFGLWGIQIFTDFGQRWAEFLATRMGWFPLFSTISDNYGRSPFVAGCVLASMVVPITTSVAREVYSRTPRELVDTCYALGGSKWGAIKTVVLPFGKSGVVGGAMLGLGRALGETIAVYLVLNLNFRYTFRILESEGGNVASLIAQRFGESTSEELTALVAAGFVLFLLTLTVNMIASAIVTKTTRS
jgi:phosphate transport system permease protein